MSTEIREFIELKQKALEDKHELIYALVHEIEELKQEIELLETLEDANITAFPYGDEQ